MKEHFNSINLTRTTYKWRIHLLIITTITIVLSSIFSGPHFIKPRYKSFSILYPFNLVPYGDESPTEQMLQILQSQDIRSAIIHKFDLMNHYQIDTSDENYPFTTLNEKFDKNIKFNKTEYESVKITVWDANPLVAANINNAIVDLFNQKARNMQKEKALEELKIKKEQLEKKKVEMDSMENSLKDIRIKYGILDYDEQSNVVMKEYLRALNGKKGSSLGNMERILKNLEEKGGDYVSLKEHLWRVRGNYNDIKVSYENTLKDVQKELTYANIVTKAYPAEKKSYPIRWLIVVISSAAALVFSIMVLLGLEKYRSI